MTPPPLPEDVPCDKEPPDIWYTQGRRCILPKGHPVTGKTGGMHELADGRVWPVGEPRTPTGKPKGANWRFA